MAGDVTAWSTTAASNASADSSINWAEGQAPSTINDSARAMMAALKSMLLDQSGSINSTGSGSTYAVTLNQSLAAYNNGLRFSFTANADCGNDPVVNVNSLGTKNLKRADGTAIKSGDIRSGMVCDCVYSSTLGYVRILNLLTVPRAKTIWFVRDTTAASASVSYTGVGFKPRAIQFVWGDAGAVNGWAGVGFVDSSLSGASETAHPSNTGNAVNGNAICLGNPTTGNNNIGNVASFDSDGFTVTWQLNGSPAFASLTIFALCWG
jgi:hypothetical protein